MPWVARHAAEPAIALRESAERQLGEEHSARSIESLHDSRIVIERLLAIRERSPRRRITLHGEQVLRAPRYAVQRTAVASRAQLAIEHFRLRTCTIFRECDDGEELRI